MEANWESRGFLIIAAALEYGRRCWKKQAEFTRQSCRIMQSVSLIINGGVTHQPAAIRTSERRIPSDCQLLK